MSKDVLKFISYWLINGIVLYLASLIVQGHVVFGNAIVSLPLALIFTSLLLTVIITLVVPVFDILKIKVEKESVWRLIYLGVNIGAIWVLARISPATGFGISRFWVAIILGIILNILQWISWKYIAKKVPAK